MANCEQKRKKALKNKDKKSETENFISTDLQEDLYEN